MTSGRMILISCWLNSRNTRNRKRETVSLTLMRKTRAKEGSRGRPNQGNQLQSKMIKAKKGVMLKDRTANLREGSKLEVVE